MKSPLAQHGIPEIMRSFHEQANAAMPANLRAGLQTIAIASIPAGNGTSVAHTYNGCACEACREIFVKALNAMFDDLQASGAQVLQ